MHRYPARVRKTRSVGPPARIRRLGFTTFVLITRLHPFFFPSPDPVQCFPFPEQKRNSNEWNNTRLKEFTVGVKAS